MPRLAYPKPGDVVVIAGTYVYCVIKRSVDGERDPRLRVYEAAGCVDALCLASLADHTYAGELTRLDWAGNVSRRDDAFVVRRPGVEPGKPCL